MINSEDIILVSSSNAGRKFSFLCHLETGNAPDEDDDDDDDDGDDDVFPAIII